MKYNKFKSVESEYKDFEKYFTGVWKDRFVMFDLYVSKGLNYREIGERFGYVSRQWIQYCCREVYKKILNFKEKQ